jgi:hypothetical protein
VSTTPPPDPAPAAPAANPPAPRARQRARTAALLAARIAFEWPMTEERKSTNPSRHSVPARAAETAPCSALEPPLSIASWNQLDRWLRQVEALR